MGTAALSKLQFLSCSMEAGQVNLVEKGNRLTHSENPQRGPTTQLPGETEKITTDIQRRESSFKTNTFICYIITFIKRPFPV